MKCEWKTNIIRQRSLSSGLTGSAESGDITDCVIGTRDQNLANHLKSCKSTWSGFVVLLSTYTLFFSLLILMNNNSIPYFHDIKDIDILTKKKWGIYKSF